MIKRSKIVSVSKPTLPADFIFTTNRTGSKESGVGGIIKDTDDRKFGVLAPFVVINGFNVSKNLEYFELDVSSKRLNDFKYFGKINDMCYNDEVGEAFFNYLLEIDTKGFVAITCMPETKAKQDAIADRLPIEYKYLKDTYILTETNLNGTVDDIYTEYSNYCEDIEKKPLTKIKFCQKLRQNLNIDFLFRNLSP